MVKFGHLDSAYSARSAECPRKRAESHCRSCQARPEHQVMPDPAANPSDVSRLLPEALSRRGFMRGSAIGAAGFAAATLAACAPSGLPGWTFSPRTATPGAPGGVSPSPTSAATHSMGPTPEASPTPGMDHDAAGKAVVDRFLGGEWQQVPGFGNQPLAPRTEGNAKVFDISIEAIQHQIDSQKPPVDALGFNGTWPGPRLEVIEGDLVRANFVNNLNETTGI